MWKLYIYHLYYLLLTLSLNCFPGLNLGVFVAEITIFSLVSGLIPVLLSLWITSNFPKPVISTFLSFCNEYLIVSNIQSTISVISFIFWFDFSLTRLNVFLIYQVNGYYSEYFTNKVRDSKDARNAIKDAKKIGAPEKSIIYFTVDCDCYGDGVIENIIPYFWSLRQVFLSNDNPKHYKMEFMLLDKYVRLSIINNLQLQVSSVECHGDLLVI